MREYRISITTLANGTDTSTSEKPIYGRLYAVVYEDGTLADTADVVIAYADPQAVSHTLLTISNKTDDAIYYPRHQVHDNTAAALTLDGTRIAFDLPVVFGLVTATTAQGGDKKSGSVTLYVM